MSAWCVFVIHSHEFGFRVDGEQRRQVSVCSSATYPIRQQRCAKHRCEMFETDGRVETFYSSSDSCLIHLQELCGDVAKAEPELLLLLP